MSQNKKWLIKNDQGRIKGPLTTEEVLKKISQGYFTGKEQIALYPGSRWHSIAQNEDFYDRLLEVLAGADLKQTEPSVSSPNVGEAESSEATDSFIKTKTQVIEPKEPHHTHRRSEKVHSPKQQVIDLMNMGAALKVAKVKKIRTPLIVTAIVLFLAALFLMTLRPKEDRIHLLAPRDSQTAISPSKAAAIVKRGVAYYLQDTFSHYMKAQNQLVLAVEGSPRAVETMALLCMTYFELWPYAYQDSKDLKVISTVSQKATTLDPAGVNGSTCRVVDLLVRGRYIEAKGLVESILDSFGHSNRPPIVFYYLKARILGQMSDYQTSLGYLKSARQLWPQWLKIYVYEAQMLQKQRNFSQAANRYHQILKINPAHIVSSIQLGLIEYKQFNHIELGAKHLQFGISSSERAPRHILSEAYFGLAEIALHQNDESAALKYAQKSYSHNSSNIASKNLIVQIGGIEKLRGTKIKGQQLIFEGDQLVREGDCNSAQAHYKSAFEINNKNAVAAIKAAQCLWELSLSTESIEWLKKAIKADSNLIESYVLLADYYTQRFNYLAAAKILARAQKLAPKSNEVYRGFALVELRRNNPKGSIKFAKKALKLYEADVETQIILAQAYLRDKKFRKAYASASKAIEIDVNHRKAQVIYAKTLAGIQGVEVGVNYIQQLVEKFPVIIEYRLALGEIYQDDERYFQAEQVYRQVLQMDEKPKKAMVALGKVLSLKGENKEALELLLKAAALDPSDTEPLFEAGILYLALNKPHQAKLQFQRVLRVNKMYPLVYYYKGRAALLEGRANEALKEANKERKVNPNLAEAYLLAADAYTYLKQYSLCAREYQKAIQMRSQGANIYVKMARCYRLSGNVDVAISMLKQASVKESGYAGIYKEQGAVYEVKGDILRAVEAYRQYLVLDPSALDANRIRARINQLGARSQF